MKQKSNLLIPIVFLSIILLSSCEKVMDKTNLSNITSDKVLNDPSLALANLNRIYVVANPRWQVGASANSDESSGRSVLMYGRLLDFSQTQYATLFSQIREVNIFLDGLKAGSIDKVISDPMRGQALFFRAHLYWQLVVIYGGVPLVLSEQQLTDEYDLPRNTTSACVTQIVTDLDEAIGLLPNNYTGGDFGRIYKGAAMAYKGRILLHYASEQFDPNQSRARWQAAYEALVVAKTNLDVAGKGLNSSFSGLWFDDGSANREIIWVRLYNSDIFHNRDAFARPFQPGLGGGRLDNATLKLINTFPQRDGKKITDATSFYAYNPTVFWRNRDPRLAATVAWNGANFPIRDPAPFKTSALYWSFQNNSTNLEADRSITFTGFQVRKGIREDYDNTQARNSTVPWIEMRYAELLLNLAEAANEVGKGAESLTHLFALRQRAGIENRDSRYGFEAGLEGNKLSMRNAVLDERMIELAFENKRPIDMRRRRLYSTINGTERQGYFIAKTAVFDNLVTTDNTLLSDRRALENRVLDGSIDLNNPAVYQTYFTTQVYSVEEFSDAPGRSGTKINFQDRYYFFDLPQSVLARNLKLKQTNGWPGGSFDPLQ